MKLLVIGSTGALGTELEAAALRAGHEFVGLSHQVIEITEHEAVRKAIEKHKPDVVVNAVAMVGIDPCEENVDAAFAIHSTAVSNLARHCEAINAVFVQPSSHAVFDGRKGSAYSEFDPPNPINVYGISKLAGEQIALTQCARCYVTRFPTMFGARRNSALGFVDKIIARLKNGETPRVADDKIDSPTYARDAAETILGIVSDDQPYGVYHITNKGQASYFDLVETLRDFLGSTVPVERAKDSDFPAIGAKPLFTPLISKRLPELRPWKDALAEYVRTI